MNFVLKIKLYFKTLVEFYYKIEFTKNTKYDYLDEKICNHENIWKNTSIDIFETCVITDYV